MKTKDGYGNWFQNKIDILQIITSEFCRKFRRDSKINPQEVVPLFKDITDVDNGLLNREATDEETLQTAVSPTKIPRPDGMHLIFYKKCWHKIGKSVCRMVRAFLINGHLLKELKKTYIT